MKEACATVDVTPVGDHKIKKENYQIIEWKKEHGNYICPFCNIIEGMKHRDGCLYLEDISELEIFCKQKDFDIDKLRLNLGSGNVRFSNCVNMEYKKHKDVDADVYGDLLKGIPFPNESFVEVLFIHVIEHIERRYHMAVMDEIWRVMKPGARLVMGFPDVIENMKRFIENKYGGRWNLYHNIIFGRQARPGDFHVTGIEEQDFKDRLMSAGFTNIKWLRHSINVTVTAIKGEKLNAYI